MSFNGHGSVLLDTRSAWRSIDETESNSQSINFVGKDQDGFMDVHSRLRDRKGTCSQGAEYRMT